MCASTLTPTCTHRIHNTVPECVTSIEPNVKSLPLAPEHGSASSKPVTVVDFPGHGRLRTLLGPRIRNAKAVLFVIDATATEVGTV
jgi:signal recognition particle receptor subunit beta